MAGRTEGSNEHSGSINVGTFLVSSSRRTVFISEMAASMWEHMKPDERWVYEEQA
jgi:hypothetical protein